MTNTPTPTMSDINEALSLAMHLLGPDAFDLDDAGNPTGYSDTATNIAAAHLNR
ncbi:hypothetical protein GS885_02415 [Rhodococcus hoagii]|nr:hypothetical protein [Prescottella equi]NKT40022.1 hypothetical protein [Prescottella equi]NKT56886.1 hypothetical protein [Prescottella equi]NKT61661.1 hypothetical protein [Prescottella equi]NKT81992.1 hypothetical protein [Prescottella equi]